MSSNDKGVIVTSRDDTPKTLYHRTSQQGLKSILASGIVPGAENSGRAHCCLDDAAYKSGMRSNMPIEIAIDNMKGTAAGCEFFVTNRTGL